MRNAENGGTWASLDAEIIPTPTGPLEVQGIKALKNHRGGILDTNLPAHLCRCGASANKPFCDGRHAKIKFRDGAPA